jgi:beta-phosphoglucomutase-like phosphatase (HAD superfamily)
LQKLGVSEKNCLVVEDSVIGLQVDIQEKLNLFAQSISLYVLRKRKVKIKQTIIACVGKLEGNEHCCLLL